MKKTTEQMLAETEETLDRILADKCETEIERLIHDLPRIVKGAAQEMAQALLHMQVNGMNFDRSTPSIVTYMAAKEAADRDMVLEMSVRYAQPGEKDGLPMGDNIGPCAGQA